MGLGVYYFVFVRTKGQLVAVDANLCSLARRPEFQPNVEEGKG